MIPLPIEDAPKDGTRIIAIWQIASVAVAALASWSDGQDWQDMGYDTREEATGWWAQKHSVTHIKVTPTHFLPVDNDALFDIEEDCFIENPAFSVFEAPQARLKALDMIDLTRLIDLLNAELRERIHQRNYD